MNDMRARERGKTGGKPHYRSTVKRLREYLRPVEPDPEFSRRLEELCESMGACEFFQSEGEMREDGGHRGIIIGGAICSALPFVGVAAYALRRHLLRRRIVPVGI
ncbi:MAG: hypothetical protein C4536_05800 [Actinobacteria bacterium]|jgi:hypothetical protein|nr:MAG: hypothetical protein C4536_05800 [Actinomycetota bacterium]